MSSSIIADLQIKDTLVFFLFSAHFEHTARTTKCPSRLHRSSSTSSAHTSISSGVTGMLSVHFQPREIDSCKSRCQKAIDHTPGAYITSLKALHSSSPFADMSAPQNSGRIQLRVPSLLSGGERPALSVMFKTSKELIGQYATAKALQLDSGWRGLDWTGNMAQALQLGYISDICRSSMWSSHPIIPR